MGGRAVIVNPHTGEAVLRDGSGNETRIIYTEQAIVEVEQALDVGVLDLLQRLVARRVKLFEVQVLVWAGINAYRARSGSAKQIAPDKAMKVLTACGGMVEVMPAIAEALVACSALGLAEADDDEGDSAELDPTNGDGVDTVQPSPPASTH